MAGLSSRWTITENFRRSGKRKHSRNETRLRISDEDEKSDKSGSRERLANTLLQSYSCYRETVVDREQRAWGSPFLTVLRAFLRRGYIELPTVLELPSKAGNSNPLSLLSEVNNHWEVCLKLRFLCVCVSSENTSNQPYNPSFLWSWIEG